MTPEKRPKRTSSTARRGTRLTHTNPYSLSVLLLISLVLVACHQAPKPESPPTAAPPAAPTSAETDPTEPEAWTNTLKWRTASEVDNFGYDIYRSESPDGPFERLTEEPVEGAGTTDEPTRYEFVDDTIDPYKAYYYYIESISMAGDRERFTPISKTKPKLPKAPEE